MINGTAASPDLAEYLEWLLPGVPFTVVPGPIGPAKDLLFARVNGAPADLGKRLARWHCQPVAIEADLLDGDGQVLKSVAGAAGVIDPTQWPESIQSSFQQMRAQVKRVRVRLSADFSVKEAGPYVFSLASLSGSGSLEIDGHPIPYPPTAAVTLEPGPHRFELLSEYDPGGSAPHYRVSWTGPDTGGKQELLPFYRLAPERCAGD